MLSQPCLSCDTAHFFLGKSLESCNFGLRICLNKGSCFLPDENPGLSPFHKPWPCLSPLVSLASALQLPRGALSFHKCMGRLTGMRCAGKSSEWSRLTLPEGRSAATRMAMPQGPTMDFLGLGMLVGDRPALFGHSNPPAFPHFHPLKVSIGNFLMGGIGWEVGRALFCFFQTVTVYILAEWRFVSKM